MRPLAISAPGSLMLLGEHAVLHDFPCLVTAIEQRIRVSVLPRNDGLVTITSKLGEYEGDRDDLPDHPSFRFILGVLRHLPNALPGGLDILIHTDMPATIGFGTSAAVTAAMTGLLHSITHGTISFEAILADARAVIQHVQGRGSGADAAASIYGGVVYYRMKDQTARVIGRDAYPVTALYSGFKTPTPEVIKKVGEQWANQAGVLMKLYAKMGKLVEAGKSALAAENHVEFGRVLSDGHTLMQQLGVSTPELEECVQELRKETTITGAKISGSGLGDCAIGWGRAKPSLSRFDQYDIVTAQEGIRLE